MPRNQYKTRYTTTATAPKTCKKKINILVLDVVYDGVTDIFSRSEPAIHMIKDEIKTEIEQKTPKK